MTEQQKGRRAIEVGPTGKTVAVNLARLRDRRGLTTRQLSGALERVGRPIPPSGITRMEKGERVVTADDLAALAAVLGVSPSALLVPLADEPTASVDVTGAGEVPAVDAWQWANGQRPLKLTPGKEQTELLEHQLFGMPQWLRSYRTELHERVSADFPGQIETDPATGLPVIVLRRDPDGGTDG
ncbi:helix-turn-helix transcriptional regulator [Streptomyces sp. S.PB5]|uniref:helix-turn-helix domain-containing protein n=1 Tax=Streptomyces sp. S.PB5 TaxID=3020844 RepID=UPI0025AF19E0|nr:helix-turn-helix transcriptional regulator [Streptomyces sp. S.PB5]MDN3023815.1 helix-turn-helix transcriptional regulator [Streptomyces sp. S.PB5]